MAVRDKGMKNMKTTDVFLIAVFCFILRNICMKGSAAAKKLHREKVNGD